MANEEERIRAALSVLDYSDRDTWIRMAMAIKSELGDNGFELWDSWGALYDGHRPGEARAVWRSVKSNGSTKIGTLFYEAKQRGWSEEKKYKRPSKEEIARRNAEAAARREQADREDAERHAIAAERATAIWNAAAECTEHPYLARKGIQSHGLRVGQWEVIDPDTGEIRTVTKQALLIPIRDLSKRVHSLQAIFPSNSGSRDKDFLKDGAKSGLFYSFGKPQGTPPTILIGEGYATMASAHAATGHACIVAFDAGNLMPVGKAIRGRFPDAKLVFLADNDQWTDKNPGVTKATEAAREVGGIVAVPPFADDAEGQPTDFNDLHLREGLARVRDVIEGGAAPAKPEPKIEKAKISHPMVNEHFRILGYNRGTYFVFHKAKQQIEEFTRGDFSETGLIELAPMNYWEDAFPSKGARFDVKGAQEAIFRTAQAMGIYDTSRMRGRGAWIDQGRVVYHHGNELSVDGEATPVTKIKSDYVYELANAMQRPADRMLTSDEGLEIINLIKMFRWSTPGSSLLFAGWIALAPVCGAIPWRPHLWITGGAGSGKSSLAKLAHSLLKGSDLFIEGNSTESGIRQRLRSDAIPVIMDESESNEEGDAKRVQNILGLIRQASTESDAVTIKGTVDGEGVSYHIRSMFCLASIQVALKHKADIDRLSVLSLRSGKNDANAGADWSTIKDAIYKTTERDETVRGRLLRRAINLLKVTRKNIDIFARVGAEKFKSQRHGDQYGTLLAGAWSLVSEDEATFDQARQLFESVSWETLREREDGDESMQALQHLMEAHVRTKNGIELTINELVCLAFGEVRDDILMTQQEANGILQRYGMKVREDRLLLSNNTSHIKLLMGKSQYAADIRGVLLRVHGADNYNNKPVKFSGVQSKCISLPLGPLVTSDEQHREEEF